MNTKHRLIITFFIFISSISIAKSQTSCNELIDFVKNQGVKVSTISSIQLLDSSWLQSVEAYKYDSKIFVIAEIKRKSDIFSKKYIFCGIPQNNWRAFEYGLSDLGKSYGERFNMYIIDYLCNCD